MGVQGFMIVKNGRSNLKSQIGGKIESRSRERSVFWHSFVGGDGTQEEKGDRPSERNAIHTSLGGDLGSIRNVSGGEKDT